MPFRPFVQFGGATIVDDYGGVKSPSRRRAWYDIALT